MKDINIGLFNDSFMPITDGVTVAVWNYAYWLNRTLGPTCVVTPSVPSYIDKEEFSVVRFLSVPTFLYTPYRIGLPSIDLKLRKMLKYHDFSILHAHSPFGAGHAALKAARASGAPIVATFHSKYRDNFRRVIPIDRFVDDQIKRIVEFYYSVDHVWVPQESVAETLREYGYKGPYEVVENGIDFHPPKDIVPLREKGGRLLGMPEDAVVGLFVGQHVMEKNLEFLVRSLPGIMAAVPNFRMAFVGQGHAKPRLQGLVSKLGISDRVIFFGPIFDRECLETIYARGDIFLFPSLFDNAPLVIREAAAFMTPSVLIRGSTAAEVIRDGENGFLADDDTEAFAARVVHILEDPRKLEQAGTGAQRTLCRTWEDVVREVRDRYLAILAE
jgi:glycosyltransferase involved in cell wall biosynthesis